MFVLGESPCPMMLTMSKQDDQHVHHFVPVRVGTNHATEMERLSSLLDTFMVDRVEGRLTDAEWERGTRAARERLRLLEEQPDPSSEALATSRTVQDAAEKARRWEELDIETKRAVISVVFPKVVLEPYGRWGKPSLELITYPDP